MFALRGLRSISSRPALTLPSLLQKASFSQSVNAAKKMIVYEPLPKLREGQKLNEYVKDAQYEKFDPQGKKRALFDLSNPQRIKADDVVTVHYKNQKPVTGQVIAVKRKGIASTMTLRNKIDDLGYEMIIPVYHPWIVRLEIVRKPLKYRPRNKHYYIRESRLDVSGKL